MKMVSAAKFHKAQDIYFRFKPYSEKVLEVLQEVATDDTLDGVNWFGKPKSMDKIALVVITSNSSMCSGFNQNLIKKVVEDSPKLFAGSWNTEDMLLICLGKKGADALGKRGFKLELNDWEIANRASFEEVSKLCDDS
jgi:F-type H+-transporting ATPase subunit gamma